MAENRLFQMVYLLMERGKATAPELAERFEVSVRTIYRDIDILSAAGIPVYTTQGKGGGIFIQESYVLDKSLISEQEQTQILLALQGLRIVDDENVDALLSKLGCVFQKQNINWIEVDFSDWNRKSEETFRILQSAIFQNRAISFTYYGEKGQSENRSAEPLKLVFKGREWYLYAYCLLRQDYRLFKLARIRELRVTEQTYVRTTPEKVIVDTNLYSEEAVPLTLLFDKMMAYRVYESFDNIKKREDGAYIVKISLPNNDSLYRFLLSFGDKLEVLAPSEVREAVIARINSMKNKYET